MKTEPLIIERTYNASVNTLWQAITDKDKMKQWYFDIHSFKPEIGFEFEFTAKNDNREYVHLCKITEIQENKKLAYTWRYKDFPGESLLTFELFEDGGKTRLQLTHEGIETFPANSADFKRESFTAGWNYIVGESLKEFVER